MNKESLRVRFIRNTTIALLFVLLIEYPRGIIHPLVPTVDQPIRTFSWIQYAHALYNLAHQILNLSLWKASIDGTSLVSDVGSSLMTSLRIIVIAWVITLGVGVSKGLYDGLRGITTTIGSSVSSVVQWVGETIPDFLVITLLVNVGIWLEKWGFPFSLIGSTQFLTGTVVPAIVVALAPTFYLSRIMRNAVLEQQGQTYLVTAKAKGLRTWRVLIRHIVPNCLLALDQSLPLLLGLALGSLIMVEYLFYQHGIAYGLFSAMGNYGTVNHYVGGPHKVGTVLTSTVYTYDTNLVFGYVAASFLLYLAILFATKSALRIIGVRKVPNPYGRSVSEAESLPGRRRNLAIGTGMIFVLLIAGLLSNQLPLPKHPDSIEFSGSAVFTPPFPPSPQHWLGTDMTGNDLLSQAVHFTIPTLVDIGGITLVVVVFCIGLAYLASMAGWKPARFMINTWNGCFTVVPGLLGALLILQIPEVYWAGLRFVNWGYSDWSGLHLWICMAVICLIEGGKIAFYLQTFLDDIKAKEYMEAAVIVGNSPWSMLRFHVWQPLLGAFIEQFLVGFTRILLLLAVLGYFQINLGQAWRFNDIPPEWIYVVTSHDWGGIFANNAHYFLSYPWVLLAPCIFVTWTVFAMNFLLKGVRGYIHSP